MLHLWLHRVQLPRLVPAWAALALLTLGASCQGVIGAPRGKAPGGDRGSGAISGPDIDPSPPPPAESPTCRDAPLAHAPIRSTLLTKDQYVRTASAALGFEVAPLVDFADSSGRLFQTGITLKPLQAEERLRAAEAIARAAVAPERLQAVTGCGPGEQDESCAQRFVAGFLRRAFRRPAPADVEEALARLLAEGLADSGFATGIEWVITGVLQAPQFLYHAVLPPDSGAPGAIGALDGWGVANRLSYFLWDGPPDEALLRAAEQGLTTREEIAEQVKRLLGDQRIRVAREQFHGRWLELDLLTQQQREDPQYSPELAELLLRSVFAGLHRHYDGDGQVGALLSDSTVMANAQIASVYGAQAQGSGLAPVDFGRDRRRGILTHPAVMALLGDVDTSNPIRRGAFVYTKVLCQELPEPLEEVPALPPLRPGLSTRARLAAHRENPACAPCHDLFEPFGLAFENYDGIGRYRQTDQGVAVDSSGQIQAGLDVAGSFADGLDLVERLAKSGDVRRCLVRHWFEFALARAAAKADSCALESIANRFVKEGDLTQMLVDVALAEAFRQGQIPQ